MNAEEQARTLRRLRRFHLTGPIPDGAGETPSGDCAPALLVPLRQSEEVRNDYPLFLYPAPRGAVDAVCAPVGRFLDELISEIDPTGDEAPQLRANRDKLAKVIRRSLAAETSPADAGRFLKRIAVALPRELSLPDEARQAFDAEFEKLSTAVPNGGAFLAFSALAPVHIFVASSRALHGHRRGELRDRAAALLTKVRALPAEKAGGSAGVGGEGRQRLEKVAETLDAFLKGDRPPLARLIHDDSIDRGAFDDVKECELVHESDPCGSALEIFRRQASEMLPVFKALRIAELEAGGQYYAPHHDPFFEGFGVDALSPGELRALPLVAAVESADRIAREGLHALSGLLRSGFPIHALLAVRPGQNPGEAPGSPHATGYRLELGYFGVSQREAWVDQSSAARPDHLARSFAASLAGSRAALHVYASGLGRDGHAPRLNTWLHAGVELEGRAHAFFRYDPEAGPAWADRLDFEGNPQPAEAWPLYRLNVTGGDGEDVDTELPFTFADFALLEEEYAVHFHAVPDAVRDEALVDIGSYLSLDRGAREERIPFVYAMDGHGGQARYAVTRRLADLCRDRLAYWNTLQEMAGTRNRYALEAADRARSDALAEEADEREAIRQSYEEKLQSMREEIAESMIAGLTGMLLEGEEFDVKEAAALLARASSATTAPAPEEAAAKDAPAEEGPAEAAAEKPAKEEKKEQPPATAEAEPAAEEAAPAALADEDAEEPWVDSAECTTCNECININDKLFVYDDDDKCTIGDPKAGTYDQLVRAAESCPVGIIHPGTPLDPNEPNLEELKKRAETFR